MTRKGALTALLVTMVAVAGRAAELQLVAVQFPEQREVLLDLSAMTRAPRATLEARVTFRAGQGQIELRFADMKPAILFGGDVTSYVVWAVSREGKTVNLGELAVRERNGSAAYTTGLKEFAVLITAESFPLVDGPSELVMFYSLASEDRSARNTPFTFTGLGPAPAVANPSIATIELAADVSPDLRQAEKVLELARRAGAESYAADLLREAEITLAQATNLARAGGSRKGLIDFAQRTVTLAGEALRTTERKQEAEELERRIAERQAQMAALEARATAAEHARGAAEEAVREVEARKLQLEVDLERLAGERAVLERQRQELSSRLAGALAQVASTDSTARGFIVNLPDILFDVNQATLKPEAKIAIAKLTGILLLMPELGLRVEGHTDSTGGAEFNQRLSQQRAEAVHDFIAAQGVAADRMTAVGYGMTRPVADNAGAEGRTKNRRVEIVIAEGKVEEAAPPR